MSALTRLSIATMGYRGGGGEVTNNPRAIIQWESTVNSITSQITPSILTFDGSALSVAAQVTVTGESVEMDAPVAAASIEVSAQGHEFIVTSNAIQTDAGDG